MKLLEERLKDRQKDLIETKRELIDARNDLKKSYKLVDDSNKRAEEAERRCEELGKNVETQAQGRPPVANIEEPGPSRKVEEAEPEDPTVESSQLQTTGGIYGDTEGDETFTKPAPPLPQRERKRTWRKERRDSESMSMVISDDGIQSSKEKKDHTRKRKAGADPGFC